jgi:hypothetical protein
MAGDSKENLLFARSNPFNALVLDAHLTIHHLNVRRYASKKVWDAA